MTNATPNAISKLRRAGTAVIADIYDQLDQKPPVLSTELWPTRPGPVSFAGPAYTIDGVWDETPRKGDRAKLEVIDALPPDGVPIFAGKGMRGVCWFGDLLATAMKCRGVAGVVVDGGVRDLAFLRELDLPMMVRYRTPAQAIGRWKLVSSQQPVEVRGALEEWVTIHPGDVVVADDDGVIPVPRDRVQEFADEAADWEAKDQQARQDIANGMKLLEAIEKYGAL